MTDGEGARQVLGRSGGGEEDSGVSQGIVPLKGLHCSGGFCQGTRKIKQTARPAFIPST